jgi:hypothetical protein
MVVVLCVFGACTIASVGASAASASLPELGRCVKVATPKTGEFTRANCIGVSAKHVGEYEWQSGPGAQKAFKTIASGFSLITAEGTTIGCSNAQLTGEYTGAKTLKVSETLLEGCELVGPLHQACYTNPLEKGKIVSKNALTGELGDIPGSKNELNPYVGWDLKSENSSMPFLTFTCGEGGGTIVVTIEGSVIGRVQKTGVMSTGFGLIYKETAGKQIPSAFIGGAEDVLTETLKPVGPGEKKEQVGLAAGATITDEESLEIKAKV